jgi:hypothetical protein
MNEIADGNVTSMQGRQWTWRKGGIAVKRLDFDPITAARNITA